jgi:hypothetical protein
MHDHIKNGVHEAAKKLLARGVTPKRLMISQKNASSYGIHATHVATPSGELEVAYGTGDSITVDGVKSTTESEVVVIVAVTDPHKKGK